LLKNASSSKKLKKWTRSDSNELHEWHENVSEHVFKSGKVVLNNHKKEWARPNLTF